MGIEFLITAFIVVISPGPGTLLTVAAGLSGGPRAAAVTALGCTLGIVPHLLAAVTGLAALLHASATAFEVLRYAGVAILMYMAWATWRSPAALAVHAEAPTRAAGGRIAQALLVNLLNPKLSLFFLTFLPQFIAPGEAQPAWRMAQLSLVFMAMTFAVFIGYGVFAARFRDQVLQRPSVLAWLRRGFAAALVGLGAKLALVQR
ncbi:MAG: LysE family translocator [Acidovorax sp.]|uniref:LysE family translocator n=1 Tax=Acidovorax sp. TaxID=1872122 RepID=UPI0025BE429A|nr:LysE family translocator [Acidovorax sp.]MCE1192416.1 LysE family translocator [Acidovorax sp.]